MTKTSVLLIHTDRGLGLKTNGGHDMVHIFPTPAPVRFVLLP